jgi:hypothetical protein
MLINAVTVAHTHVKANIQHTTDTLPGTHFQIARRLANKICDILVRYVYSFRLTRCA